MSASSRWRRYRRRRMVAGAILAAAILILLVALAVGACGGNRASSNGEAAGKLSPARSTGGSGSAKGVTSAQKVRQKPQPFAAIRPKKNARPLEKNLDASYARKVFSEEEPGGSGSASSAQYGQQTTAQGGQVRRSVPLGRTLLDGKQDLSDGPLKNNRVVAYYGTPLSDQMGILGEYGPREMMRRLKQQTAAYSNTDPAHPAVPAVEFIASVAQRDPGVDGLYISQPDTKEIKRYAELAKKNHALLILDVQLGRAGVMQEVKKLEPFLKEPYVHLAIDTEYSVDAGQTPGVDLGSVSGAEIEQAVQYLDSLVKKDNLPDKLLMVHEFQEGIVTDKQAIKPTANVEVALHADGFGYPQDKFAKYGLLVRDEPIQYGGFKVFYTQDSPVLAPKQVLALDPAPAIVTYQ